MIDIVNADAYKWACEYDGEKYHAILCDPPYDINFMGREWDKNSVAFQPDFWRAIKHHLHPGAFGMAFSSTRTYHRLCVAIEDAGFIIHPMITWVFGSGFPKATRIDTQVDRAAGAAREIVGSKAQAGAKFKLTQNVIDNGGFNDPTRNAYDVTAPATDLARTWHGHRYGLQAMKPALEPIVVFQKPYDGKPVDSITRTGAGALWIDGARVGSDAVKTEGGLKFKGDIYGKYNPATESDYRAGRWPANLVLSHSPTCTPDACADSCAVRAMGAQSGERHSAGVYNKGSYDYIGPATFNIDGTTGAMYADTGTAARFFHNSDWQLERLEDSNPFLYSAKASTFEREAGLGTFPPLTVGDGRDTPIDNPYQRGETARRNPHPTVKPLKLTHHLATLLLPPPEYGPRRLLVPFAGVASEVVGAMLAGWEVVTGVEMTAEYVPYAQARIKFWQGADSKTLRKVLGDNTPAKASALAQDKPQVPPAPLTTHAPQKPAQRVKGKRVADTQLNLWGD
jgi:hypothetical protein